MLGEGERMYEFGRDFHLSEGAFELEGSCVELGDAASESLAAVAEDNGVGGGGL